jgi:hypothetical protein
LLEHRLRIREHVMGTSQLTPLVRALAVVFLVAGCHQDVGSSSSALRGGVRRHDPCATVRCAAGTHCEAHGRNAECVPDPDAGTDAPAITCASVLCIIGTVCEETPSGPRCVPSGTECTSDSECRAEDNYCGGCHCLALDDGETGPVCDDPVQCFAAPCQVTSGVAACVDGQCVMTSPTF